MTRHVGETTTKSVQNGFSVEAKGRSLSHKVDTTTSTSWSMDFHEEFTSKSSDETKVTITDADAQKAVDDGNPMLWSWKFTTTYNWNDIDVITYTQITAYTKDTDVANAPKCYPNQGRDIHYQDCVDGGWLPGYEPTSGNETLV